MPLFKKISIFIILAFTLTLSFFIKFDKNQENPFVTCSGIECENHNSLAAPEKTLLFSSPDKALNNTSATIKPPKNPPEKSTTAQKILSGNWENIPFTQLLDTLRKQPSLKTAFFLSLPEKKEKDIIRGSNIAYDLTLEDRKKLAEILMNSNHPHARKYGYLLLMDSNDHANTANPVYVNQVIEASYYETDNDTLAFIMETLKSRDIADENKEGLYQRALELSQHSNKNVRLQAIETLINQKKLIDTESLNTINNALTQENADMQFYIIAALHATKVNNSQTKKILGRIAANTSLDQNLRNEAAALLYKH